MQALFIEPFIESRGEHRAFWLRRPRRIGERLLIAGKGARIPASETGRAVVLLEARHAFGTGGHGTTEGCLLALERYLQGQGTVLDIGTGTGILAIAACKLGAGSATATDIDRAACMEARTNISLNGLAGRIHTVEGSIPAGVGPFDVVIANLRPPVLARLLNGIVKGLSDGGTAILSGILEAELHPFIALLETHPLAVLELLGLRGWMTVVAAKKRSPDLLPEA
jgi:ribosomal protein L11 methyltransferase